MNDASWSPEEMLEVRLNEPDDFLKVRETLSRIGVASRKDKTLFQSCHILHKQGKYYIVHFKELFALDGKDTNLSENDIARRNTIANLLADWGLVDVVGTTKIEAAPLSQIKVISFKEKGDWKLETKYIMTAARKQAEGEVATHIANIKVYQTMPAGIGEHSDITEAVIEELNKLAAADDRLEMINKYFQDDTQLTLFS